MTSLRRGAPAALFLAGVLATAFTLIAPVRAVAAPPALAPGETRLSDGLTTVVRQATGSGAVVLEIWVRCPSDGWSGSQPGIARLAAFAVVSAKVDGNSLRDLVRADGGQLSVSVFQTSTEFAILAPANSAPDLLDSFLRRIFHPTLDDAALDEAKSRLAEQQASVAQSSDALLREGVFSTLYSAGPLHASTFGDAAAIKAATLSDARDFATRSYVPGSSIFVAVGNASVATLSARLAAAAPKSAPTASLPQSSAAAAPAAPVALPPAQADVPGVALAWLGPRASDARAATAMDFLSDYLADVKAGTLSQAATRLRPTFSFNGQFITLGDPGIFFVSTSGEGLDPLAVSRGLEDAMRPILSGSMSKEAFAQALGAYETRLLRQVNSPQGIADNYGWYFVQGVPEFTPGATNAALGGAYFETAASLTPDFVHDVAKRYLSAQAARIVVTPQRPAVNVSTGGT